MDLRGYERDPDGFGHVSLLDVLAVRDLYHAFLMNHPRVVATAVGLYRIRRGDSWPGARRTTHGRGPRSLANSEIRSYSWPAVLVFVSEWLDQQDFAADGRFGPSDFLPPALELPDGRRVPVCAIEAPQREQHVIESPIGRHPLNNLGGGSPVFVSVQGRAHFATIACLVSDGHTAFALTNRHVAGDAGTRISSELGGKVEAIGTSSPKSLSRVAFEDLYPGWPARHTYVNVDVGLIEIDDLDPWTATVADIGTMGPMADLSVDNISLSLIGCRVRGHGAASGAMRGEVQALFYRYQSQGGLEYIADALIGPRPSEARAPTLSTHHGDSGTLWLLEPNDPVDGGGRDREVPEAYLPLAVQWGHEQFSDTVTSRGYALVSFLSRICAVLEVEPIRDWNLDTPDTWGAVGHFSIASRAAKALSTSVPKLKQLMNNNLTIITHDDHTILTSAFANMGKDAFVPMADVPDFFWKHGRQGHSRGSEGPNHFADMDQPRPADGKTLLDLAANPANVDPKVWNTFYDSVTDLLDDTPVLQKDRGSLPFRVWEIFDAMVDYARRGRAAEFVCAAGVLTHYIGDACQPLHISYLFDGDPLRATTKTVHHHNGTTSQVRVPLGTGVHSAYEDEMVNAYRQQILDALDKVPRVKRAELVTTGKDAAIATIALMRSTIRRLPPPKMVDTYAAYTGAKADRAAYMWRHFGPGTKSVMVNGTHLLGVLWQSAWVLADGDSKITTTAALTETRAMSIVGDPTFVPSVTIDQISSLLT
jgi:hypothetical protein